MPVRNTNAEKHLLYVLAGFAGSVIVTRTFLNWTGYPQIASGDFHIAHVLWGGLLLFIAALLVLIWRGRMISRLSAVLTGIGFGLFIDEVGKFITADNDYFYPLAAPIIYAVFLLTLLIFLLVRRSRGIRPPTNPHAVLALLEQGLGADIQTEESRAVMARLQVAAGSADASTARLATHALDFLAEEKGNISVSQTSSSRGGWARLPAALNAWFTKGRLRRALILGSALLTLRGLASAVAAVLFVIALSDPQQWGQLSATTPPLSGGAPFGATHLLLVSVAMVFEGVIGILMLAATSLLVAGRMRPGLAIDFWALLFSLTAVHLVVFYFNQFDAVVTTLMQFALLVAVRRYQSFYLE